MSKSLVEKKKSKRMKLMDNVTKFEHLPNELLIKYIFVSFDLYSLYDTFYGINLRYNKLVTSCRKLQLDMEEIPSSESVSFIFYAATLFPKGSVRSLKNIDAGQIEFLSEDYLFLNLIGRIKSLILNRNVLIKNIFKLLRYANDIII